MINIYRIQNNLARSTKPRKTQRNALALNVKALVTRIDQHKSLALNSRALAISLAQQNKKKMWSKPTRKSGAQ